MVQFKSSGFSSASDGPNGYWKIKFREKIRTSRSLVSKKYARKTMATIGYSAHASDKMTDQRKNEVLVRHDRGLLEYEKCTVPDLRRFCKSRGILASSRAFKADLVQILERSDEEFTFDRFLDLPPELRVIIYKFHLADLKTDQIGVPPKNFLVFSGARHNTLPTQPPVTRASRLLRHEALPLFYSECTFNFIKHNRGASNVNFQHSASPEILSSICNFRLTLVVEPDLSLWHIDINKDGEVTAKKLEGKPDHQRARDVENAIEKRAQEVREHIRARGLGKGQALGLDRSNVRYLMGNWPSLHRLSGRWT